MGDSIKITYSHNILVFLGVVRKDKAVYLQSEENGVGNLTTERPLHILWSLRKLFDLIDLPLIINLIFLLSGVFDGLEINILFFFMLLSSH